MSIKVKFDRILGRLREMDCGGTPPPDPSALFRVSTAGDNKVFYADEKQNDTLTVVVTLRFDGQLVDADTVPSGWTRTGLGTYQRSISEPGIIAAQAWSYTPGGAYGSQTCTGNSEARSLKKVWPAYWGIWPGNDASGDITAIVADLKSQHRLTSSLPATTIEMPNPTGGSCWLWIVTHGSATAQPAPTPGISMMEEPVTGKQFDSPMPNADWRLDGYKAYVSIHSAKAGASFGNVILTVNL